MADLFPDRHDLAPAISKSRRQRVFQRPEDAAIAYGFGEPNRQWIYLDQSGVEVGRVLRWDHDNPDLDKIIRPISLRKEGWEPEAPLSPRPLFNLPQINATPDTVVTMAGSGSIILTS